MKPGPSSATLRFPTGLRLFEPSPPAAIPLTDPVAIAHGFRSWQRKVLVSTIIGYATFYFVRKNLGIAMPSLEADLHISKTQLGLFLTLHGLIYGLSKFINGVFGDRCNARAFMTVGLVGSAVLNVLFGLSSTVPTFGVFWMLNGWFQGMGFPPCTRLLTHWFPPDRLATKWSIWNTSHCLGAGLVVILCSQLVATSWRLCFFVPAAIAFVCAVYLWLALPDTPPSVGLPEVEGTHVAGSPGGSTKEFLTCLVENVFRNKYVWIVSIANFFVYTLRYAVFDWGATLLTQAKHLDIKQAGWILAGFEGFGLLGALLGGWLTDRLFGGRASRACLFYMALAGVAILVFWKFAGQSLAWNTTLLCVAGFFIYGPQCLVAVIAANLGTKRAAATAVGLTGVFGYLSTILSGWGLGALVQHYGWDAGFIGLLIVAALGTLVFAAAWPAKAHGYQASS